MILFSDIKQLYHYGQDETELEVTFLRFLSHVIIIYESLLENTEEYPIRPKLRINESFRTVV